MYPSPASGMGGANTWRSTSSLRSFFAMATARLKAAVEAEEKSVGCRMRRNRLMRSLLWASVDQPRHCASAPAQDIALASRVQARLRLPRPSAARRARAGVLEPVAGTAHRLEARRAEREGSGLAGTQGGRHGRRGARPEQ